MQNFLVITQLEQDSLKEIYLKKYKDQMLKDAIKNQEGKRRKEKKD